VLQFSKPSKVLALSLVALMLLAGAVIRPASALSTVTPTPNFSFTGSPALNEPTYAIVYNGNLWVSDWGAGTIEEYAAPITANEAPTLTLDVGTPSQLAFDPSGNLWVGSFSSGHVLEFDAPITNLEAPSVTLGGLDDPAGVTLYQGNLWVFDYGAGNIYKYVPEPTSNIASPPAAILVQESAFEGAFDSSGNLWVGSVFGGGIDEYAAPVTSAEAVSGTLTTPLQGEGDELTSLSFDGAGNLFVGNSIPSGVVAEFASPVHNGEAFTTPITISSSDTIWGATIDQSGNIWVADFIDSTVYEFGGIASGSAPTSPHIAPPLPTVIPKDWTYNFKNSSSIVGKEVGLWGYGVMYNVPGFNPKVDFYPYAVDICNNVSNSTISISGFFQYGQGNNATEFFVYNWSSIHTPSAGWPSELACKA
jgi:streptogramin lyase